MKLLLYTMISFRSVRQNMQITCYLVIKFPSTATHPQSTVPNHGTTRQNRQNKRENSLSLLLLFNYVSFIHVIPQHSDFHSKGIR
uniref:Putative ovule protein n=1 Tax=Solanum chacoense TaxID=4108 RepID=A0A0V0HCS7_SOLCH